MTNDLKLEVLQRFLMPKEEAVERLRVWLCEPFNVADKTASTNAVCLIAFPKFTEATDKTEDISGVYPLQRNMNIKIDPMPIKKAISKLKQKEDYSYSENAKKCSACDGQCEVEYEFSHGGETYKAILDCPVCDGEGMTGDVVKIPNGKKIYGNNIFIMIGNSYFSPEVMNDIIFVAEKMNKEIYLVNQSTRMAPSLFAIGDAEILAMPCAAWEREDNKIIYKINI